MITLRDIRDMEPGQTLWDEGKGAVPGFLARRQKSAAVSYVLFYRTAEGRQRWFTIGRHGAPWTPDSARDEAKRLLGEVVAGRDPAGDKKARRTAETVADLCDAYLADAEAGRLLTRRGESKKASTIGTDRGRIERHIKPILGPMKVAAVTRDDIDAFLHAVAAGETAARVKTAKTRGVAIVTGGRGTATRTTGLLGAIFSYAVRARMRPDNPVHGVQRFADGTRDRRLSPEEYAALGAGLSEADPELWPSAIVAARFIALTGWRRGEVLGLEWAAIDLGRQTATLADTKTGRSIRPLPRAVCDLLKDIPQIRSGLVFPATRGDGQMAGFPKFWKRIVELGGLPADITPHVLRHSFASVAGDLGYSDPVIAALIGHKGHTMTRKYIHSADDVLIAAANTVAGRIAEMMSGARADD